MGKFLSYILNILNVLVIAFLISAVIFILYTVIIKKDDYLNPAISPINNIITSINEIKNKPIDDKPYLLTPSSVTFNKDVEFKGKLKLGENGKYFLTMDNNNNLTLNNNELPLLKFVDMEKDNDKYIDTKFCFNEDCSKYMNINKFYGITTNQELNKI